MQPWDNRAKVPPTEHHRPRSLPHLGHPKQNVHRFAGRVSPQGSRGTMHGSRSASPRPPTCGPRSRQRRPAGLLMMRVSNMAAQPRTPSPETHDHSRRPKKASGSRAALPVIHLSEEAQSRTSADYDGRRSKVLFLQ